MSELTQLFKQPVWPTTKDQLRERGLLPFSSPDNTVLWTLLYSTETRWFLFEDVTWCEISSTVVWHQNCFWWRESLKIPLLPFPVGSGFHQGLRTSSLPQQGSCLCVFKNCIRFRFLLSHYTYPRVVGTVASERLTRSCAVTFLTNRPVCSWTLTKSERKDIFVCKKNVGLSCHATLFWGLLLPKLYSCTCTEEELRCPCLLNLTEVWFWYR